MTDKATARDPWPASVRVITYGLTSPTPAMENVDQGVNSAIEGTSGPSPDEYLTAIRMALASDVDLQVELHLENPNSVVREYLREVEARLGKRLGA